MNDRQQDPFHHATFHLIVRISNIPRLKDILNDYFLNCMRYKAQFLQPTGEHNKKAEQFSLSGFR